MNEETLHRRLMTYDTIAILGSRAWGKEEVFTLTENGVAIGEPLESWSGAVTRFRELVLEKKKNKTQ